MGRRSCERCFSNPPFGERGIQKPGRGCQEADKWMSWLVFRGIDLSCVFSCLIEIEGHQYIFKKTFMVVSKIKWMGEDPFHSRLAQNAIFGLIRWQLQHKHTNTHTHWYIYIYMYIPYTIIYPMLTGCRLVSKCYLLAGWNHGSYLLIAWILDSHVAS